MTKWRELKGSIRARYHVCMQTSYLHQMDLNFVAVFVDVACGYGLVSLEKPDN